MATTQHIDHVAASKVQFGAIDDYYPESEITDAKRDAWTDSAEAWRVAVRDAIRATSIDEAIEALALASRIEREWGDDPSTREVRRAFGLE